MESGLPSQLRDAVLSTCGDSVKLPESDVGKEYQVQKQLLMLENGENPWQNELNPNEMLLEVARSAVSDREHHRIKLPVSATSKRSRESFEESKPYPNQNIEIYGTNPTIDNDANSNDMVLPAGITDVKSITELSRKIGLPASLLPIPDTELKIESENSNLNINARVKDISTRQLPPRPSGPPPASAFKKKSVSDTAYANTCSQ